MKSAQWIELVDHDTPKEATEESHEGFFSVSRLTLTPSMSMADAMELLGVERGEDG
jgi:hypothetical protein